MREVGVEIEESIEVMNDLEIVDMEEDEQTKEEIEGNLKLDT